MRATILIGTLLGLATSGFALDGRPATQTRYVRCQGSESVVAFSAKTEPRPELEHLACERKITVVDEQADWTEVLLPYTGARAFVATLFLSSEPVTPNPPWQAAPAATSSAATPNPSFHTATTGDEQIVPSGYVEATLDDILADPRFQALSPEAKQIVLRRIDPVSFLRVYDDRSVTPVLCRLKLKTAEQAGDQMLLSLPPFDLTVVTDRIGLCVKVGVLRPSELRRTALVLSRLLGVMRASAEKQSEASCEEDKAKQRAATEQLVSQYNDLVDRFNTLQSSYSALWQNYSLFQTAALGAEARMQNELSSCASNAALQQAIEDYLRMERMRELLPPKPQRTECHTEYDGAYGLNTICH